VKAVEVLSKSMGSGSTHQLQRLNQLDETLGRHLLEIFPPTEIQGSNKHIELLNIAAALCCEMEYDKKIRGLGVSPKSLVSSGYLSVWKRERPSDPANGLAKFFITRPFFSLSADDLLRPLEILTCVAKESPFWTMPNISLSSLVLEKDCADYMTPNMKGQAFEVAVASSLYARYILSQKKGKGSN